MSNVPGVIARNEVRFTFSNKRSLTGLIQHIPEKQHECWIIKLTEQGEPTGDTCMIKNFEFAIFATDDNS